MPDLTETIRFGDLTYKVSPRIKTEIMEILGPYKSTAELAPELQAKKAPAEGLDPQSSQPDKAETADGGQGDGSTDAPQPASTGIPNEDPNAPTIPEPSISAGNEAPADDPADPNEGRDGS